LDWRDLMVYVRYADIDSSLVRVMHPDKAGWSRTAMLLAEVADSLHWLMWAKTKAGQRGRNRPALIVRPGVGLQQRPGSRPKAAPLSVIRARFARRRQAAGDRAAALKTIFGGGG
jgi:hypothetical protein